MPMCSLEEASSCVPRGIVTGPHVKNEKLKQQWPFCAVLIPFFFVHHGGPNYFTDRSLVANLYHFQI